MAKGLIVAAYGGIKDEIDYPATFQMGKDNRSEEFLTKLNPTGQVPAIETPEGPMFESNAIAFYFAHKVGKGLLGKNSYEFGLIHQWVDFFSNHIARPLGEWTYPYYGFGVYSAEKQQAAIEALLGPKGKDPLGILDRHLAKSKFIVDDSVTVADIIIFCNMMLWAKKVAGPEFVKQIPNVQRWFNECAAIPEFISGNYGEKVTFATEAPATPVKKD